MKIECGLSANLGRICWCGGVNNALFIHRLAARNCSISHLSHFAWLGGLKRHTTHIWHHQNGSPIHQDVSGYGPRFTDTVTVNGHSVTFQVEGTSYGRQFLFDEFSTRRTGADYLYTDQRGMTGPGNGDTLRAFQYAYSYNTAFVPGLDFNQPISHIGSGLTTWSEFVITGQNHANFLGNATSVAVSAVPEPETYAMMLAGLGMLGFLARRKNAQKLG